MYRLFLFIVLFVSQFAVAQRFGSVYVFNNTPEKLDFSQAAIYLDGEQIGHFNSDGMYIPDKKLNGTLMVLHPLCDTLTKTISLRKDEEFYVYLKLNQQELKRVNKEIEERMLQECGNDFYLTDSLDSIAEIPVEVKSFLAEELKYPQDAVELGIQGTVFIGFVVTESGELECITLLQGAYPSLDIEALRVVQKLPKFTPAIKNGKSVRSILTFPIKYRML